MKRNKSKNELVEIHGLPGAIAVLVIKTIENEKLNEVDLTKIKELWILKYQELTSSNNILHLKCDFHAFKDLIFQGDINMGKMILNKKTYCVGDNYLYVKTAIGILKADYNHMWPSNLKPKQLWKEVFQKLKMKEVAYNSQLHVLKALIENGRIETVEVS
jgi:hypothetical protein